MSVVAAATDETLSQPHFAPFRAAIEVAGPASLAAGLAERLRGDGVHHGDRLVHVDAIPRVLARDEWDRLAAGLEQRVRALEAFVADALGSRRAVAEGVVTDELLDTNLYLEPELSGLPQHGPRIGVYGPDVVRGEDGTLVVLEDNARTPTGMAFATHVRPAIQAVLGDGVPEPLPFAEPLHRAMREALGAAAPWVDAPHAVILGDGPADPVGWEASVVARDLGIAHLALADLAHAGGRLVERVGGRPIDVVYRRTAEERLRGAGGALNALGQALLGPLRAGRLAVVNAFGTGVADDKRSYAYVEDLVRLFCGEEPLIRSLPTLDLARPEAREEALDRMAELVFKARSGSGGHGLVIGPRATPEMRNELAARIRERPGDWVAQELLPFGTHPTVVDGTLAPRHVDLRPFVVGGRAVPGGLSRVALGEGELVVNLSQGGGGKDTWVLGA